MSERLRIETDSSAAGQRLDRFLAARLSQHSRSQLQAWIRDGRVQIDGRPCRASALLAPGQWIELEPPEPAPTALLPEPIPLNVLYEDEHILVLLKPPGLQVHPGAGPPRPTLAHALLHRYPDWAPPGSPERPGLVHRLDRDTSGLMVVARTPLAWKGLGEQILRREITRRYVALAWGRPETERGRIDAPIGRDPRDRRRMAVQSHGRPAATRWQVLRQFDSLFLVDVVLETGRTHQIRVHLSHIGHPLFADPVYGGGKLWWARLENGRRQVLEPLGRRLNRQALHAYHLAFRHPADGRRLRFEAPVPADMDEVLTSLAREGAGP